jgi:hypothetical protein
MLTYKKFEECNVYGCRWSELFAKLIGGWYILYESGEPDYQGSAEVLAYKDGQFYFVEWSWGSCSYCDPWEDLEESKIMEEISRDSMYFPDAALFYSWITMLKSTNDNKADKFLVILTNLGTELNNFVS